MGNTQYSFTLSLSIPFQISTAGGTAGLLFKALEMENNSILPTNCTTLSDTTEQYQDECDHWMNNCPRIPRLLKNEQKLD